MILIIYTGPPPTESTCIISLSVCFYETEIQE
jgi:hypothetical protein